jgi:hypothetical protein
VALRREHGPSFGNFRLHELLGIRREEENRCVKLDGCTPARRHGHRKAIPITDELSRLSTYCYPTLARGKSSEEYYEGN